MSEPACPGACASHFHEARGTAVSALGPAHAARAILAIGRRHRGAAAASMQRRLASPVASLLVMVPVLLAAALLASRAASARPEDGLSIVDPWMRAIAPGLPAAGYFTLHNASDHPRQLVSAASPACGALTLHETIRERPMHAMSAMDPDNPMAGMAAPNGVMRMRPVRGAIIPAHDSLRFAPGGYHLMCERPKDAMRPGSSIEVTLLLADGQSLAARFPVRGPRDDPRAGGGR